MARATGTADLPLHGGRVPRWLGERMARLGRLICETIVLEYGRDELLRRLSDPFWFQSFGAVMGMDWHSSGITTSVVGALKRGLRPVQDELGLYVCGGRGRHSRRTPEELTALGEHLGLDGSALARTSKLVAKVDSAAVQDGFALYLHSFLLAADGSWVVVQQGMSDARSQARRYHWHSADVGSFVEQPHSAIEGESAGTILNLTDRLAARSRQSQLALVQAGPDRICRVASGLGSELGGRPPPRNLTLPHLELPFHHDVRADDVHQKRLYATLAAAADRGPTDFAELLLQPGLGARTVQTLAAVAEVVHGAPCRFEDPARFSLALGGKDGHPFPVPLEVYDRTLQVLRQALAAARLGSEEKLDALRRLDRQARRLEQHYEDPSVHPWPFEKLLESERRASPGYGGRTVFDDARRPRRPRAVKRGEQLGLWS